MLSELPPNMNGKVTTPMVIHLLNLNPEAKKLPVYKAKIFPQTISQDTIPM